MIVSHKYQLIFVKTTKTAGTSVEIALSEFLGENDIITPLIPADEAIRVEKGFRGAQNYIWFDKSEIKVNNHCPIRRVKKLFDATTFNSYYKVGIARNPWERVVSAYFYRESRLAITGEKSLSFNRYLNPERLDGINGTGWGIYTINDQIVVDEVIMYHNLNNSYKNLLKKLGIVSEHGLPFTKVAGKKETSHYSEMYNKEAIELVEKHFAKEIEAFGFKFEYN